MNFNFAEQINADLERLDFDKALQTAEAELAKLPPSLFHEVTGKSLTSQAADLAAWIMEFYNKASVDIDIQALYFEMNEFDINTGHWYIDGFAFSQDGGLDPDDMDWLSDFEADSQSLTETVFLIQGYESLQEAFENEEPDTEPLQDARDWCEQIIIARFMELIRAAHLLAKEQHMAWADVPVYCTEHAYDFVVRSEIK